MARAKNTKLALANVMPRTFSAEEAQSPEPANTAGISLDKGFDTAALKTVQM